MQFKKLEFHEMANIFPMMTKIEIDSLAEDIKKNGLREAVWLYNGKIIDGRNRYLACASAGVKPIFKNYTGAESELLSFVISLNLHRRHLTTSQKACLAVAILPKIEEQTMKRFKEKISLSRKEGIKTGKSEPSRDIAGKLFAVSNKYVSLAKKIKETNEALFQQVVAGEITLSKAQKEIENKEIFPKSQHESKFETKSNSTYVLTKRDKENINKYILFFGVSTAKATEFILNNKVKQKQQPKTTKKKIEFRVNESEKEELQQLAKHHNISLSELIRLSVKQYKGG